MEYAVRMIKNHRSKEIRINPTYISMMLKRKNKDK
jgi:hypothetical protein